MHGFGEPNCPGAREDTSGMLHTLTLRLAFEKKKTWKRHSHKGSHATESWKGDPSPCFEGETREGVSASRGSSDLLRRVDLKKTVLHGKRDLYVVTVCGARAEMTCSPCIFCILLI